MDFASKEQLFDADSNRCTAMTMHKGRCRWTCAKGSVLCGHHLSDSRRGCTTAHQDWCISGAQQLESGTTTVEGGDILSLKESHIALRVQATHTSRMQFRLENEPFCCTLVFIEKVRKGKTVLMLFAPPLNRNDSPDCVLQDTLLAILADKYLVRVLAGFPAVVQHCTPDWKEAKEFHSLKMLALKQNECDRENIVIKTVTDPQVRALLTEESANLEIKERMSEIDDENGDANPLMSTLVSILSVYDNVRFLFGCLPLSSHMLTSILEQHKLIFNKKPSNKISKAVLKIEEIFAIRQWGERYNADAKVALDIGASPGSWSAWLLSYMRQHACQPIDVNKQSGSFCCGMLSRNCCVVAVDPGDLSPEVTCMKGLSHVKMLMTVNDQNAIDEVTKAINLATARECDCNSEGVGVDDKSDCIRSTADILVCDMNRHPVDTAELLEKLGRAGVLAKGARLVFTLKTAVMSSHARSALQSAALKALGDSFIDKQVHHLFGNTRYESTVTAIYWPCEHW